MTNIRDFNACLLLTLLRRKTYVRRVTINRQLAFIFPFAFANVETCTSQVEDPDSKVGFRKVGVAAVAVCTAGAAVE